MPTSTLYYISSSIGSFKHENKKIYIILYIFSYYGVLWIRARRLNKLCKYLSVVTHISFNIRKLLKLNFLTINTDLKLSSSYLIFIMI